MFPACSCPPHPPIPPLSILQAYSLTSLGNEGGTEGFLRLLGHTEVRLGGLCPSNLRPHPLSTLARCWASMPDSGRRF